MERKLAAMKESNCLPPNYFSHPVVRAQAPKRGTRSVFPFGVYVDGVSFARSETAVGFWLWEFGSDMRWLLTVVRKADLCQCSCRGWCTMWQVFDALRWSVACMATGLHPTHNYDGKEFGDDLARASLAGTRIGCRGCIIALRCDMSELATSFGLPSWADTLSPCPWCDCNQELKKGSCL